jgi:hypothetical protein
MATLEINTVKAFLTAKEVLKHMIQQGFGETRYIFALSNRLITEFNLTQEQSTLIIENALNTI